MSNECNPEDIMNQIPVSQNWDFQTEYTGNDILALPAYVDIDMMDGSVGPDVLSIMAQLLIFWKTEQLWFSQALKIFRLPCGQ